MQLLLNYKRVFKSYTDKRTKMFFGLIQTIQCELLFIFLRHKTLGSNWISFILTENFFFFIVLHNIILSCKSV